MKKNEIDKKLTAKLKLFDDIDKMIFDNEEGGENEYQVSGREDLFSQNIPTHNELITTGKINVDNSKFMSPEISTNAKPSNSNLNNIKNISNSRNSNKNPNFNSDYTTKEDFNFVTTINSKEFLNKNHKPIRGISRNNKASFDQTASKNSLEMFRTDTKNVGERLYYKGIEMKRKVSVEIENKMNRSRNGTPEINSRSRQIIKNNQGVFDRLYPFQNERSVSRDSCGDVSERKKRKIDGDYNFQPKINKKSNELALNKGASIDRLLKPKKRTKNESNDFNKTKSFTRSFSKTIGSTQDKSIYLFEQADFIKKKKDAILNKKVIQDEINLRNLPFRPNLNRSKSKDNMSYTSRVNPEEFFMKNQIWKQSINNRNEKIRDTKLSQEFSQCTFRPNIQPLEIRDDEKFINRNLDQIVSYVNKRQKILKQKEEQEIYSHKKLNFGDNFDVKPTKIKEFPLTKRTENDSPKFGKKILKMRESFKTQNYFEKTQYSTSYLKKMNRDFGQNVYENL